MNLTVQGYGATRHLRRAPLFLPCDSSVPTEKTELRRSLRARRNALSPEDQRLAAERLASNLIGTRLFLVSRRIACYLPNDGEIDTGPVIEHIRHLRKICYLPVLSRLSHDRLWFAEAKPKTKLVPNRFGIPEPAVKSSDLVRAQELDLILMPLVGFDDQGNRLGMGGGLKSASAFLPKIMSTSLAGMLTDTPKSLIALIAPSGSPTRWA